MHIDDTTEVNWLPFLSTKSSSVDLVLKTKQDGSLDFTILQNLDFRIDD